MLSAEAQTALETRDILRGILENCDRIEGVERGGGVGGGVNLGRGLCERCDERWGKR